MYTIGIEQIQLLFIHLETALCPHKDEDVKLNRYFFASEIFSWANGQCFSIECQTENQNLINVFAAKKVDIFGVESSPGQDLEAFLLHFHVSQ